MQELPNLHRNYSSGAIISVTVTVKVVTVRGVTERVVTVVKVTLLTVAVVIVWYSYSDNNRHTISNSLSTDSIDSDSDNE